MKKTYCDMTKICLPTKSYKHLLTHLSSRARHAVIFQKQLFWYQVLQKGYFHTKLGFCLLFYQVTFSVWCKIVMLIYRYEQTYDCHPQRDCKVLILFFTTIQRVLNFILLQNYYLNFSLFSTWNVHYWLTRQLIPAKQGKHVFLSNFN